MVIKNMAKIHKSLPSFLFLATMGLTGCATMSDLPEYTVLDKAGDSRVLTTPAEEVTFPLSAADKETIRVLVAKFDQEENCAGLAAPQIGIHRRIIVFSAEEDSAVKAFHSDHEQFMPKTVWINPTYTPIGKGKTANFEGCFSVDNLAGPVPRFTRINYSAYTPDGQLVKGEAKGFLARVIQHEIDHLNGKLFKDLVPAGKLKSLDQLRAERKAQQEAKAAAEADKK
jgi:peptide deformylase